jgi:uncharacterized RDD family membrane protein YckC
MFTIIGGDGKEYGPASADQIRAWITAGRANLSTQARAAGTDVWRPLGDFPEFTTPDQPPEIAPPDTELADRGIRLLAKLLDEVCAIACALPGIGMIGFSALRALIISSRGGSLESLDVAENLGGLGLLMFGLLALAVVQIWLISTRGQSIGKIVFGIRIVRVDGGRAGFVHGWLLRSFVPGFFGLLPFGLGFVYSIVDACFIFRADRRCIHDFIASTRVVKV